MENIDGSSHNRVNWEKLFQKVGKKLICKFNYYCNKTAINGKFWLFWLKSQKKLMFREKFKP